MGNVSSGLLKSEKQIFKTEDVVFQLVHGCFSCLNLWLGRVSFLKIESEIFSTVLSYYPLLLTIIHYLLSAFTIHYYLLVRFLLFTGTHCYLLFAIIHYYSFLFTIISIILIYAIIRYYCNTHSNFGVRAYFFEPRLPTEM